jgi:uncharacterized protein YbjT (DUF2867 family)
LRALVSGATGTVGGKLATAFAGAGARPRCLVRDAGGAGDLRELDVELVEGDVLEPSSLGGAFDDVEVAYYLIHSMGRGASDEFAARERRGARNFARAAGAAEVARVVYLGGLGDELGSEHLRSRHETAEILAEHGPPLTYFRAAMVVGAGSESFRTLRYLVERLPVMIAPAWLRTETQPVALEDVVEYLRAAPEVDASAGREVQIGGPDVLSYADMLDAMADALGTRRRPKLPVPLLTPSLSSLWIGLVTPVDAGVARPLVEGLRVRTVVTDPSGAAFFEVEPTPLRTALERALEEEEQEEREQSG